MDYLRKPRAHRHQKRLVDEVLPRNDVDRERGIRRLLKLRFTLKHPILRVLRHRLKRGDFKLVPLPCRLLELLRGVPHRFLRRPNLLPKRLPLLVLRMLRFDCFRLKLVIVIEQVVLVLRHRSRVRCALFLERSLARIQRLLATEVCRRRRFGLLRPGWRRTHLDIWRRPAVALLDSGACRHSHLFKRSELERLGVELRVHLSELREECLPLQLGLDRGLRPLPACIDLVQPVLKVCQLELAHLMIQRGEHLTAQHSF
mmetsp:Transcript_34648/g.95583  ORF Transcript_34648/g.95583 Transcript_34648/m.95583 type:complete len:258 (-) Transcript_34648:1452-2225(-)